MQEEKEIKVYKLERKKIVLLFTDDVIVYVEIWKNQQKVYSKRL